MKTLVIGSAALLMSTMALAKDESYLNAGHKMAAHQAVTSQQHAQDRVQSLYYYGQAQQPIPKAEAKELVEGIKKDLKASQAALAKLQSEHAKNKDAIALIDSIKKHHAKAEETCGMAEEACLKEEQDEVVVGDCCSEMFHEIEAAKADTQKLLKLLKIELEPPKKPAAAKKAAGK